MCVPTPVPTPSPSKRPTELPTNAPVQQAFLSAEHVSCDTCCCSLSFSSPHLCFLSTS
jgi:hypothetical protein